jgi:hypothetical protein
MKTKPKNSALKRNKIAAALQNAKIKKRTDSIEFIENATNKPLLINKQQKNKCK